MEKYYDVLGVSASASPTDIKTAFFLKAREVHPDKYHCDPAAAAKFQVLAEAYEVLTDPIQREAYEKYGKNCVKRDRMMDQGIVFEMLFGGNSFKHYIGQLTMASLLSVEVEDGETPFENKEMYRRLKIGQKSREDDLVQSLKERLHLYIQGEVESFSAACNYEAKQLSTEVFGKEILWAIGYVYVIHAAQKLRRKTSRCACFGASIYARSGVLALTDLYYELNVCDGPVMDAESLKARKERMVASMWNINVRDIKVMLSRVCRRVLGEKMVTKAILKTRAEALEMLGKIFQAHGEKFVNQQRSIQPRPAPRPVVQEQSTRWNHVWP